MTSRLPRPVWFILSIILAGTHAFAASGPKDREYAVSVLTRIATPVLEAAAEGRLQEKLPCHDWEKDRSKFAALEALGRTLDGIAPWLELGPADSAEGRQRAKLAELARRALSTSANPKAPGHLDFSAGNQCLVDAAFLAQALLRAPHQLWEPLSPADKANLVAALNATRVVKPYESNWLLFSATVETALWHFTGDCLREPIAYALLKHEQWYVGDGTYGDGSEYHWDYYNSYVIQPMLATVADFGPPVDGLGKLKAVIEARTRRYAAVQERLISPEGSFPVIGRSSAYRFGAFQHLSDAALRHRLPGELQPAAVRSALNAVIRRMVETPGTFDDKGWLQVGAVGHQPSIREGYISTGSLYLCLTGLLHLGLPETDPLWTEPEAPWTQRRIWSGQDTPPDHALYSK